MDKKYIEIITPIILVVAGFLFYQKVQIKQLKATSQVQAIQLATSNDSVLVYRSKTKDKITQLNNLTFKLAAVEIDKANLKESLEAAGIDIDDLKNRDIEWRKVVGVLQAEIKASGKDSTTLQDKDIITKTDTIHAEAFVWSNRYLTFSGDIVAKKMKFNYEYKTGLDILQTPQGKKILISVYLSDPKAVVTTASSIVVTFKIPWYEKPWLWGAAGLVGGYFIAK